VPRYHFNVFESTDGLDEGGVDLPDKDAARIEAIRYAGISLGDAASKGSSLRHEWRMEVTDEIGLLLFLLEFRVTEAPSVLDVLSHKPAAPTTIEIIIDGDARI
jgi:hypothetical protein